ncbi:hypothetical protein FRX31_033884 [Thalictrum thalictroides]|uniref:Uncharacterized protein n=1 Tax=Thalictrum thalictroides TaxID=46969 RepID=A0A7J6UWG1_THATH|nr:hypothetical protein FRX31_033884 [Thalictrum thalictroides]
MKCGESHHQQTSLVMQLIRNGSHMQLIRNGSVVSHNSSGNPHKIPAQTMIGNQIGLLSSSEV